MCIRDRSVIVFVVLHVYETRVVFSEEAIDESGQGGREKARIKKVRAKYKQMLLKEKNTEKRKRRKRKKKKKTKKMMTEMEIMMNTKVEEDMENEMEKKETEAVQEESPSSSSKTEGKPFVNADLETKSHSRSAKEIELVSLEKLPLYEREERREDRIITF